MNAPATPSGGILRYGLIFLLLVMIAALWYDYKVARFNVESAISRVEQLSTAANNSNGRKHLTSEDVRTALNREPARVFDESGYRVEVYSWRAGLPILTRDYFAVYTPQGVFLKHYPFELPVDELTGDAALISKTPILPVTQLPPPPSSAGSGPRPGRRDSNQDQPPAPESKAPESKAPETKAPESKAPETKAPETKAPNA